MISLGISTKCKCYKLYANPEARIFTSNFTSFSSLTIAPPAFQLLVCIVYANFCIVFKAFFGYCIFIGQMMVVQFLYESILRGIKIKFIVKYKFVCLGCNTSFFSIECTRPFGICKLNAVLQKQKMNYKYVQG